MPFFKISLFPERFRFYGRIIVKKLSGVLKQQKSTWLIPSTLKLNQ
ncbi:hypothetical protein B4064_1074 [Caldibacillus thermoamylovorans]|uniref:Uncharacterized protein n=1 Tax=Caldibacillus thermoamylovorans TaxID=35841 RepID=A0ABD4ADB0_9BACI|nr:hypothetical protein B4064_1074 [Caldibacillus thermoamylovorans]KIO69985.1 hypothetical protein B4166_1681 [Caldibacillus thermoamylovorans]KIO74439.1 hypothetical protein B4167_1392 [Caldibacillus thermoamylovorans]